MSRSRTWALVALLVALVPGSTCKKADVTARLDEPVTLRKGQWAAFSKRPLEMSFLRVVQDSRCPTNVQCIRAGEAVVQFAGKSSEGGFGTFLAELPAGASPTDSLPWTTWGSYRIRVLRLEPYPVAGIEPDSSAFVATFLVTDH